MSFKLKSTIPAGTQALIFSKYYYGVLSKSLGELDIDRYFSVLYFLNENNGCSQQQICNNLAIDKTAMVKVINYLIKNGYVQRTKNPDDRREQFILLTKKGLKRTEQVVAAFRNIDKSIFAGISREHKENFFRVLALLCDKAENLPGNDLFFNYKRTSK